VSDNDAVNLEIYKRTLAELSDLSTAPVVELSARCFCRSEPTMDNRCSECGIKYEEIEGDYTLRASGRVR